MRLGWTDASNNLWLFGGQDVTFGNLNDLWKFDPTSTEWTWMSGSNTDDVAGIYGTLGTPAAANVPGSRNRAASWTDSNGNFWLSGGGGNDASGKSGYLNDLWMYSPSLNQWTWLSGGNAVGQPGVYGTLGTPIAANVPGSRRLSVSWMDSTGNLWIFGGSGLDSAGVNNDLNDLWEYQPAIPTTATPTFSVAAGTYSATQTVTITDATTGASIYYTTDGTTPTTSSTLYSGAITVANSETLKAIAVAPSYFNSAVASAAYTINVPADFSVTASPTSLTLSSGQSGTITVSVIPQGGFASAVSFACSQLPHGDTCTFSPATVTPSGGAIATTTVTVSASATSAAFHRERRPLFPDAALAAVFCCIGLRKRRRLQALLLLAISVAGLGLLGGCGGGGGSTPTQPFTGTVAIAATSGTIEHTTTFAITINPGN